MSAPEKENLNGEIEAAEEKLEAVETAAESEVPSDSELPEIPAQPEEVTIESDDDESDDDDDESDDDDDEDDEDDEDDDDAEEKHEKRAPVIVMPEEAAKSKVAEKRRVAEEEARKKKRNGLILKICLPIVVLAFALLAYFESPMYFRMTKALQVGDTSYSVAEFNYFYTSSFSETYSSLQSSYGDYVSYMVDTSKPLSEQHYSDELTWEDFTKQQAMATLQNVTALSTEAKNAGFELSEEDKERVDSSVSMMEYYAQNYGYTTDDYLAAVYGRGMNKETYRKMVELTYYASAYSYEVANNPEPTAEEIDAAYAADPNLYDTVSFRYFHVSATNSTAEDAVEKAKAAAEKMATAGSEQEFMDYAVDNISEEYRETYNADSSTMASRIAYSSINTGYADWLFDASRKAGDTYVYESVHEGDTHGDDGHEEGEVHGYYVLYFISRDDIKYDTVNVRHILIKPETAEDGTATDAAKAIAKGKAEALLDQWKSGDATEESFAALATENSADTGSTSKGGLYENVKMGQMVPAFNDWSFDSSRKTGDTGIVESSYGYHIMYFVGVGVNNYTNTVKTTVQNQRYADWQEANFPNYEPVELSGMKYACNM